MTRRVLVLLLVLALAAPALAGTPAGAEPERSDRFFAPRLWVMHDSIMYSASDDLRAALPHHRVSFSGWPGYTVGVAPELVRHERHLIDNIVVVSLGTNYLRDAAAFRRGVARTMDALNGVTRVVWITPQLYRPDINEVIDVLEDEARRRPNLELLDWTSVVAAHPGLTRPGDVHLSPAGEAVYAELIADAVIDGADYDYAPVGRTRVRARRAGVVVQGWAKDPVDAAPADVLVQVDGETVTEVRDRARPGFRARLAVADGTHDVCIVALDPGDGRPRDLGCRVVTTSNDPRGRLAIVAVSADEVVVSGWAMDPDGRRPVEIEVVVDGVVAAARRADRLRRDVEAAFDNGARHGFRAEVAVSPGAHEVCIRVDNIFGGVDTIVDCVTTI